VERSKHDREDGVDVISHQTAKVLVIP